MLVSLFLLLVTWLKKDTVLVYERSEWKKTMAEECTHRPTLDILHLILKHPNSPNLCHSPNLTIPDPYIGSFKSEHFSWLHTENLQTLW